ncbi:hypothetical protein LDO26_07405 [Luteimonas sp. BDR2-5]|uniref:hypothetical protein n=1 Tax=Proluteimonas luteida TaxID=2878685 RepID=UPI001E32802D|nr:hypothetical protein [Luteimonas sp. BDR2-5]MCD9028033.1 hypothetical protein [Luteimonas sp. BDR2-5]
MTPMHDIVRAQPAPRPAPRAVREFGTGYGRSHGDARQRSYATASMPARFRVA